MYQFSLICVQLCIDVGSLYSDAIIKCQKECHYFRSCCCVSSSSSGAAKVKRNGGTAGVKRELVSGAAKVKRNGGTAGVKRELVDAIGSAELEDVEYGDYGMILVGGVLWVESLPH